MKKRNLRIIIITFIMLCLLPSVAASAITFGINSEEAEADNTISDTNGDYTLQITSSNPEDYVTNWTMQVGSGSLPCDTSLMDGLAVYVAYLDTSTYANHKPHGTITVSLAGGNAFSVDSFVCGNGGAADNLAITTGSTTESFPVAGFSNTTITPSFAFHGITSFTLSWGNDNEMYFDNFNISFNPVITTQPGNASVASGGNTSFTVDATGNILTYQWQVDTSGSGSSFTNVANGGVYAGATTATLSITGVTSGMNHYQYRCIVTSDGTYSTTSNSATLTILAQTPTNITLDLASIAENTASGTKVGGLTTTDADSSTFTYSLVDTGTYPDNADFTVVGSDLKLNTVPNFENKSSYSIRIRTKDDTNLTYDKTFTITITDVNDAPTDISLSNASIAENSASGTIGTLSGTDPDAGASLTYSLPAGLSDNASFSLTGSTLKLAAVPDYETKNSYTVTARVSDGTLSYDKAFIILITGVNEAPTGINLSSSSVLEHSATGTAIGTFSGVDPDAGSTFTYSFIAGEGDTDNGSFIVEVNALKLGIVPDSETKDSYSIRVRVSDGSLTYDRQFTIAITDGNDPPTNITITGGSVPENAVPGSSAGTLVASDPNSADTFTYSLAAGAGGTDNASFSITDNVLKLDVSADYEAKNSYSVRIRATDNSGLYYDKALVISVTNVNEAPTDISLSSYTIAENTAAGTTVGTLSGTDPDAGAAFSYTLAAGAGDTDNSSFTLSGNELKLAVVPDYEAKASYGIRVRVSDGGLTYEETFTINITGANDAPNNITLSSSSILDHCAIGTAVGTLSTADQDGGAFTYSLAAGVGATDNGSFSISGDSLQVAVSPDFEVKDSLSIRIRTTDSTGLYYEKVFTIDVIDGDDPPTDISITSQSIAENSALGTTIGTLSSADTDASFTFTYSLVSGSGDTNNASFMIAGDELKLAVIPNYEAKNSYSIRIRTTDETAFYYEKAFTISITNVNEAPTDVTLSNTSVAENTAIDATVGSLIGTDVDAGTSFTYSLVAGAGDTDNASFTITDNELKLVEVPDYEAKTGYAIRIRVSDGSLTFEKQFAITVLDGNDAPTDIGISSTSVVENTASGTTVATIDTIDPNGGSYTYSLVGGAGSTDNSSFMISGNSLGLATVPDYETKTGYEIRIRTTDSEGMYYEEDFVIAITDVNEAPTNIALSNSNVNETSPTGTAVGTLSGTDTDAGSTFTYSLISGTGDTDNASFMITGNTLQTTVVFDYEAQSSYSIRIRIIDAGGLWYEKQFTLSIAAVPPADDGGGSSNSPTPPPTYNAEVESGTDPDTTMPVTVDKDNGSAGVEVGSGNGFMSVGKTTVITVPSVPGVDTYTLGIPTPDLSTTGEQGYLTLNTDTGSITILSNMLTGVTDISGTRVEIAIGQGDKTRLPEDVKAAVGDKPLVQLTLSIDGKQTSWNNPDAPVTVSIPYTPTAAELANPESIVVWYIDGSGNVVSIPNGHYDPITGMVTFDTTHFSDYAVAYNPVSFNDVAANAWYNKAVSFIAARKITSGTGNGKYSPEAKLTRGEFIVLMMRAYGIAPDENPADNFSDAGSAYYTGYLAAAKRLGISAGVGNNMYAPSNQITRQEMFTLLYNALKEIGQLPQGDSRKALTDFADAGLIESWAKEAMTLLVETGTVRGNNGKLTPTSTTTRAEMAQVLYDLMSK